VDVVKDRRWLASCNPRVTLMGTQEAATRLGGLELVIERSLS